MLSSSKPADGCASSASSDILDLIRDSEVPTRWGLVIGWPSGPGPSLSSTDYSDESSSGDVMIRSHEYLGKDSVRILHSASAGLEGRHKLLITFH